MQEITIITTTTPIIHNIYSISLCINYVFFSEYSSLIYHYYDCYLNHYHHRQYHHHSISLLCWLLFRWAIALLLDDDNDNISVLDSSSSRGWRSILNIVRFLVGDGDGAASADNFFFRLRFHWCRHFILYLHPPKIIRIEVSSVSCFFFVVVALLWLRFLINSSVVTSDTVLISDGSALSATSRSNTYPQRRGGHEPAYFRPNNVDFLQKSHLAIVFKISTIARQDGVVTRSDARWTTLLLLLLLLLLPSHIVSLQ